jgi:hypothetical protein
VRIVAIVAALVVAAAAQGTQPAARPIAGLKAVEAPLFGVTWIDRRAELSRLDSSTLEPFGPALTVRDFAAWSFSPDRDRLAIASSVKPIVRFVDVTALATVRSLRLARSGTVQRIDWLGASSVVVLHAYRDGTRIVWLDATGRVTKRARLGVFPFAAAAGGGRLVALLPPRKGGFGAARLAIAGANGKLRVVRLPGIRVGSTVPRAGTVFQRVVPGLALDAAGGHAYVVGTEGVAADVDLRSLAVATHTLGRARSLAARLGGWLVPEAEAKAVSGPTLAARWLGSGLVAVAGTSYRATLGKDGDTQSATPLGLRIVDVRTWTERTVDADADGFAVADGALLAYGVRSEWRSNSPASSSLSGMGVAGYGPDGSLRFRLLPARPIEYVQANGSRAYGWLVDAGTAWHLVVLDAAAGAVERELTLARPTRLLLGDSSAF